jgi:5-methylcytosine-specific restriction enzyme subunit McrC
VNHLVSVREYARLTTEPGIASLDCAQVSASAFDYLCRLNSTFSKGGAQLMQVEDRRWLRLDNHVGVIQTPCGTTLEILPKHHDHGDDVGTCRALLRKMIQALLELPRRTAGQADLERFDAPLTEWVMRRFLTELDLIVKRGVRFDYQRIEDELPFLRGQLHVMAQMRQPPGRAHRFQVRHDVFVPDRPENRLLKLALVRVREATQDPDNWRLAQELSSRLSDVPPSGRVRDDFRAWGSDRLMAHYRAVKPWCELILNRSMPMALMGSQAGLSLLFPMEKLFEHYVARWLRTNLPHEVHLTVQAARESLCLHEDKPMFRLSPDLLLTHKGQRWVLDTKWKRIDGANREDKYGLSQSDFYQMYAYGQKYMKGQGRMALIYPRSGSFVDALAPFSFSESMHLHVLPFDLDAEVLLGWDGLEVGALGGSGLPAGDKHHLCS